MACEFSGTVRRAFAERGHFAVSCDLLPADDGSRMHIEGDALDVLDMMPWDLLIAHPPCTYLTNAGVRHLHSVPSRTGKLPEVHGARRFAAMIDAGLFFQRFLSANVPRICVENPIPHKHARTFIGDYSQIVQPWQHGHGETKATCLWLKGLPPLKPSEVVAGREARVHRMAPAKDRWKARSVTFPGIAKAMAEQWG